MKQIENRFQEEKIKEPKNTSMDNTPIKYLWIYAIVTTVLNSFVIVWLIIFSLLWQPDALKFFYGSLSLLNIIFSIIIIYMCTKSIIYKNVTGRSRLILLICFGGSLVCYLVSFMCWYLI